MSCQRYEDRNLTPAWLKAIGQANDIIEGYRAHEGYRQLHGEESWELDALEPNTLAGLVDDAIRAARDDRAYHEQERAETVGRQRLAEVADDLEGEEL